LADANAEAICEAAVTIFICDGGLRICCTFPAANGRVFTGSTGGRHTDTGMTTKGSNEEHGAPQAPLTQLLLDLRDACAMCSDEAQFAAMVRQRLQPVLAHGSLVAAIVRIGPQELRLVHALGVDHPAAAMAKLPRKLDLDDRPALRRWLDTNEPQVLQMPGDAERASALERRDIDALGIRRLALHGRIDLGGIVGSCFSFCHLNEDLSPSQTLELLRLVIPPLHEALMRVWRHDRRALHRPLAR
jgi:hypothetical protein